MNKLILGLLALPLGACAVPAVQSGMPPVAVPGSPDAYPMPGAGFPACRGSVVTVKAEAELACDVSPPQQLDVVYDEGWWGEAWGGDASVEAAADDCDLIGGRQFWVSDGHYRLICQDVDY
jgi:hypothetical protein